MLKTILITFMNHVNNPKFQVKEYSYLSFLDVKEGDIVVVEACDALGLAKVSKDHGLSRSEIDKASKFVVSVVDLGRFEEAKKQHNKIKELRNRLRERKEEMEDMVIYRELAKTDPEIRNLVKELGIVDPTFKFLEHKENE